MLPDACSHVRRGGGARADASGGCVYFFSDQFTYQGRLEGGRRDSAVWAEHLCIYFNKIAIKHLIY
jgi:hypothetical protein